MQVPFVDLKQQYQAIQSDVLAAVGRVFASGQFVLGPEVEAFEAEFARYVGAAHAVAVNTGTSALHLALLAAGVGPGDEVITVPLTFVATAAAIGYTGARPVFVDVDPVTYTMDPSLVEAAISKRTRALLPVHLYGQAADMNALRAIADRYGLALVEDAAQAHGAHQDGRPCGSLGDLACFSFYPGKNLGAYGEGGLVATSRPEYARTLRMLRDWGAETKYHHVLKGFNYRMDGVQGAVLRIKLRHLERWTEARRRHAAVYNRELIDAGLALPLEAPGNRHVYHVYAVLAAQRDELAAHLAAQGVQTGVHYPIPVHLLPAWADLGYQRGDFPVAERVARQQLSLPMYPELTRDQLARVTSAISLYHHVCLTA